MSNRGRNQRLNLYEREAVTDNVFQRDLYETRGEKLVVEDNPLYEVNSEGDEDLAVERKWKRRACDQGKK